MAQERARLFGVNRPYLHQDPAVEHQREVMAAQAVEGITTEQQALEAIGRALAARNEREGIALAGGIAQHALDQGWDAAVDLWCQPMLGGLASRGGWHTARSIRAAQGLLTAMAAKRWPPVLADMPTVQQVAAEVGVGLPE